MGRDNPEPVLRDGSGSVVNHHSLLSLFPREGEPPQKAASLCLLKMGGVLQPYCLRGVSGGGVIGRTQHSTAVDRIWWSHFILKSHQAQQIRLEELVICERVQMHRF